MDAKRSACVVVVVGVLGPVAPGQALRFVECTQEAGLVHTPAAGVSAYLPFHTAGGAVGDFNNDGWTDVFVLGGGGGVDRLFINQGLDAQGHAHFVDEAPAWGVDRTHHSFGAAAADYDGDGDTDLYVTSYGPGDQTPGGGSYILYRNDSDSGADGFTDVSVEAGLNILLHENFFGGTGSAWGDYDLDGDLDLYVCAYRYFHEGNRLFRNDGDSTFTDVTDELGMAFTEVNGFLPAWVDLNGDIFPELVLIGDTGTSKYFVNNAGASFTQTPGLAEAFNNAMGVSFGDLNNDGLIDLYVTGSHYPFLGGPGNQLMLQRPDGSFEDVAVEAGVMNGGWAWGTVVADLDLDGLEDIACASGFNQLWTAEPVRVWLGEGVDAMGVPTFTEQAAASGLAHTGQSRGLIHFDADNDGDQDVVVLSTGQPLAMYRNDTITPETPAPGGAAWLRVRLDTSARDSLAPDGFGALVTVQTELGRWIEPVYGRPDHCTTGEAGAHFGLGGSAVVEALRVRWNDGTFTTLVDLAPNQIIEVRAPSSPADLNGSGAVDAADVLLFLEAASTGSPAADVSGDWRFDYTDVLVFMGWFAGASG